MRNGYFITLEGGEGAGKSTLQAGLAARLRKAGFRVVLTREPGGTPLGKKLRKALLHGGHVSPAAELLLYAADRAQHVDSVISPALDKGYVVLCDRFSDSTVAYQGYGRKLDLAAIERLNQMAQQGVEPDLTLWLDLPAEAGLARTRRRSKKGDRLEAEARVFHERVRKGFRAQARRFPHRIVRIDAAGSAAGVADKAWRLFTDRVHTVPHGV